MMMQYKNLAIEPNYEMTSLHAFLHANKHISVKKFMYGSRRT